MNFKQKAKSRLVFFSCFSVSLLFAQNENSWQQKPSFRSSGLVDVYYVYDFNQPQAVKRQPFLFNYNRHNEFNLNLGFIKFGLEHEKYRANLALQAGTYCSDNYSDEPGSLKNIFEANVGLALNKKNNLWLDVGIFGSHIGFESAISTDNWTMTRSLLAENSPYYLSGAKLTYNPNDDWELAGLVINGWQRMQRLQGNSLSSFGTQVKYRPTEKMTLNWSTFIGTDDPDTTRRMRYFNNFYGQIQMTQKLALIAGFDIGIQQRIKGSSNYDLWFSPVLIGQYAINQTWKTAIRAEYYQDETGIIIPMGTTKGFTARGLSVNLDYLPAPPILCRIEGRWLNSKDKVFETNTGSKNSNFIVGTSIAIRF